MNDYVFDRLVLFTCVNSSQALGEGIFAGTKITPKALVQTLTFEEPSNVPVPAQRGKTLGQSVSTVDTIIYLLRMVQWKCTDSYEVQSAT